MPDRENAPTRTIKKPKTNDKGEILVKAFKKGLGIKTNVYSKMKEVTRIAYHRSGLGNEISPWREKCMRDKAICYFIIEEAFPRLLLCKRDWASHWLVTQRIKNDNKVRKEKEMYIEMERLLALRGQTVPLKATNNKDKQPAASIEHENIHDDPHPQASVSQQQRRCANPRLPGESTTRPRPTLTSGRAGPSGTRTKKAPLTPHTQGPVARTPPPDRTSPSCPSRAKQSIPPAPSAPLFLPAGPGLTSSNFTLPHPKELISVFYGPFTFETRIHWEWAEFKHNILSKTAFSIIRDYQSRMFFQYTMHSGKKGCVHDKKGYAKLIKRISAGEVLQTGALTLDCCTVDVCYVLRGGPKTNVHRTAPTMSSIPGAERSYNLASLIRTSAPRNRL